MTQKRWQLALATRRAKDKRALKKEREEAEKKERSKPRLVTDRDQADGRTRKLSVEP